MSLSNKQRAFCREYLIDFNATQAAIRAGYSAKTAYSIGPRLLKDVGVRAEYQRLLDEKTMGKDEILSAMTAQARGDIGVFFKVVEEWTFYPLPSYEVIDAKEVIDETDPEKPQKRISYWVRHIAVDMDKVIDPQYSYLLAEFSDSPKDGIGIKPYSKQRALEDLAKIRGMMVDKTELTGANGGPLQHLDLSSLSDDQIERIAAGEDILQVLATSGAKHD